ARVLGDLAPAELALLGELLEVGDHDREQLEDDARADVGHDAEREDREALERAAGEHADQAEEPPRLVEAGLARRGRAAGHRAARREGRELAQVDDGVGHARYRAEAALRQPALERHLAALVAGRAVAPRARAPPLVAAAGRLALARAGPAADPLRRPLRAGG